MFMRSALLACATAIACVSAPAFAQSANEAPARCAETSFRVYFQHGSASLDDTTAEMLQAAARNVAGCDYRELRVALDASSPYASQRGAAITAAARDAGWGATRVEARTMMQRASYSNGPEYALVTMSPNASAAPATPLQPTTPDIGA